MAIILEQKSWHGFTGTCKLSYLDLVTNISRALISSKRNFGPGFLSFFPSLSPSPPSSKMSSCWWGRNPSLAHWTFCIPFISFPFETRAQKRVNQNRSTQWDSVKVLSSISDSCLFVGRIYHLQQFVRNNLPCICQNLNQLLSSRLQSEEIFNFHSFFSHVASLIYNPKESHWQFISKWIPTW